MGGGASSWALPVVKCLWPSEAHLHPCSECLGTCTEPMTSSRAVGQNQNDLETSCLTGMRRAPDLTAVLRTPRGMHTYCMQEIQAGEEAHGRSGTGAGNSIVAPGSPLKQPVRLSRTEGRRKAGDGGDAHFRTSSLLHQDPAPLLYRSMPLWRAQRSC